MKKQLSFGAVLVLLTTLVACGGKVESSKAPVSSKNTITSKQTTSKAPAKSVSDLSISLGNENSKAYITVRGKQINYAEGEFKWAWGLKAEDGTFHDGKASPSDADFEVVSFDSNNNFTVKYCLTDIATLKGGTLYRIYGGTPETYGDIPFASNQFGATDATRKYYLRQDQDNALIFDNIQPIKYTKASIVEIKQDELPEGIANAGAYLKVGGTNSKNLTMESINELHQNNNIAGNFQRVIPADSYQLHNHVDEERFWKIEDNYVYFYLYVGFIDEGEGWMLHFDIVGGSTNAGLTFENTLAGETAYEIGGDVYRIYADKNASGESNYWGCLGVFKDAKQA